MKLKKFLHNFTGHLKTVNAHKKLVRQHCFRLGLYKQEFCMIYPNIPDRIHPG